MLDYTNKDAVEWTKKAYRRKGIMEAEDKEKDLLMETEVATKQKEAHEQFALLEVEKAYLPPEKPKRKPLEPLELMSPEDKREERKGTLHIFLMYLQFIRSCHP